MFIDNQYSSCRDVIRHLPDICTQRKPNLCVAYFLIYGSRKVFSCGYCISRL